ncbi:MAG: nickel/cobalt efflux transporter RcnA, partial [Hyphomicrobiales bacterium]|nr:nickel/cobalt efflux transporter RcnA [Hyphomicrobiales bacterium]
METFSQLLQQGAAHAWLFAPSAVLLGALHGLEPGHSKTMMAAFIIAVRGTLTQAVLLGLAATVSHTIVVWIVALAGLHFGAQWGAEASEPYFQMASAVVILCIAAWMLWRTWRDAHGHHHHHHDEAHVLETGAGRLELSIFEDGVPPRWRIARLNGRALPASAVRVETRRPDGARQTFAFRQAGDGFESVDEIPEPHEFVAMLALARDGGDETHEVAFHEHSHDLADDYDDEHARAHARDIEKRFANRQATTGQIVMFGLTGGLIPCPASITILLLCLQIKQFALGAALVFCFSIGLAITMVSVGAAAALSVRHASARWSGFDAVARRAP